MTKRRRPPLWESEVALAIAVVDWLGTRGWEVYQEVQVERGGPVCDLIAVAEGRTWAIETKLAFGLPVVEQALYWTRYAHHVSIATPPSKTGRALPIFCAWQGIGRLEFRPSKSAEQDYFVEVVADPAPKNTEAQTDVLLAALRPEHKTACLAGGNKGGYLTPFKETCRRVLELVQARPGISVKDLVAALGETHYASPAGARYGIAHAVEKGWVPGVRIAKPGQSAQLRLFPILPLSSP